MTFAFWIPATQWTVTEKKADIRCEGWAQDDVVVRCGIVSSGECFPTLRISVVWSSSTETSVATHPTTVCHTPEEFFGWFPRLQVATACFSCSPPELNLLDPYFIFMYMLNNHCHRATPHLQLNLLLLLFSRVMLLVLCYWYRVWRNIIYFHNFESGSVDCVPIWFCTSGRVRPIPGSP